MSAGGGRRRILLAVGPGIAMLLGRLPGIAQETAGEPPGRHYLSFEAEKVFTNREQWQTQNWNNPSGGEWICGNINRGSSPAEVQLPGEGTGVVGVRGRRLADVDRREASDRPRTCPKIDLRRSGRRGHA